MIYLRVTRFNDSGKSLLEQLKMSEEMSLLLEAFTSQIYPLEKEAVIGQ